MMTDWTFSNGVTGVNAAICPDWLQLSDIGAADNFRGKVIRSFFWMMQLWKP